MYTRVATHGTRGIICKFLDSSQQFGFAPCNVVFVDVSCLNYSYSFFLLRNLISQGKYCFTVVRGIVQRILREVNTKLK
jgi:hypothetical protein